MVISQIFCLVVGVLGCVLALSSKSEHEKPARSSLILTGLLSLLSIGLAFSPIAISPGFDPGRFLALGIGLLSGIAMSFLGAKSGPIFAIGIAGLLSAIPPLQGIESSPIAVFASSGAGLGLALLLLRLNFGLEAPILVVLAGMISVLAGAQLGSDQALAGNWFLAVSGAVLLVASALGKFIAENPLLGRSLLVATFLALMFLVCDRMLMLPFSGVLVAISVLAMVAVAWALPMDGELSLFPALLCGILWIAVGTTAFAEARGLGMGICAFAAIATAVILGHSRAALTAAPLAFLAIYRAFGVAHPDASKALDIGQHYGLIGLMLGILVALALAESSEAEDQRVTWLTTIATIVGCGFAPMLLGAKGSIGILAGLGLAPVISLLRPRVNQAMIWPAMVTLTGAMIFAYSSLKDKLDIDRDAKLGTLVYVAIFFVIAGVAAAILNRPKATENPS
jgi:hypothetical protein